MWQIFRCRIRSQVQSLRDLALYDLSCNNSMIQYLFENVSSLYESELESTDSSLFCLLPSLSNSEKVFEKNSYCYAVIFIPNKATLGSGNDFERDTYHEIIYL